MKKHLKYLNYIIRHKWFVFKACRQTGVSLWRSVIHDWSKFLPFEWFAYVNYFYGPKEELKKTEPDDYRYWQQVEPINWAFDKAWLHHQHWNKHHWQHWVLREDSGETKVLMMPEKYAREMVADWFGAGRAITGKWEALNWYEKNADKIQIHDETKMFVHLLLRETTHRICYPYDFRSTASVLRSHGYKMD